MKAQDILADDKSHLEVNGQTVRKGTIAAFIGNVRLLEMTDPGSAEYEQAVQDLYELLPGVKAAGVFEVFKLKSERVQQLIDKAKPDYTAG